MKIIEEKKEEGLQKQEQQPAEKSAILLNKNELPSRGVFYDTAIYLKKMTVRHINDLGSAKPESRDKVIRQILADCVRGIDVRKILLHDRTWLFYKLRFLSVKKRPRTKFVCESCGKVHWRDVEMEDMVTYYYDTNKSLEFSLPDDQLITIKFPTIAHEEQILKEVNRQDVIGGTSPTLMMIAAYIDTINGEKSGIRHSYNFLNDGDPDNYEAILDFLTDIKFGSTGEAKFVCDCGNEIVAPVEEG